MRRITLGLGFIAIFGALVFSTTDLPAQTKASGGLAPTIIGIVDVESVVKEIPEAIEADKKLKETMQQYQDSAMKMQKDWEAKVQAYQKQKAMMAVDKQQQEEEKLQKEGATIQSFYNEKLGNTGEVAQTREKLLEPIREKVKKAIEAVAKDEKINLVLSKDPSTTAVLYSDSKLDITFRVIDRIKRDK